MKDIVIKLILWYLRVLASLQLKKIKPFVIGVGGASGKTSLSNFIYLILDKEYKVKQGKGKNSETGIPLDILGLQVKTNTTSDWIRLLFLSLAHLLFDYRKFDIYVAEMGIDSPLEPKNMSYLLKIVKPQTAVLTNISYEHSQQFDPLVDAKSVNERKEDILELTAKQEGLLLTTLTSTGVAVLNIDDENIANLRSEINATQISVSANNKDASFYIEKIQNFVDKFLVVFVNKGKTYKIEIGNPLPKHFAYSFVLAIAVASTKGVGIDNAIKTLESDFSLPAGRMTVFKGIKDTVLIDSSYNNATLTPILDLLDFVFEIGKQRRRVGIIGDMRELGTMSKALHEEVAKKILKTLDFVILIGPLSQKYIEPILERNKFEYFSYLNFTQSKNTILENIKPKDIVLIKGSQNTLFLERAIEMLLQNKSDVKRLCRRGEFWEKIRAKTL
ncbi:MAG: UDP-N-acetylmuramoyl-tripeptide-D-alanyl-D-alanine ligase [Candidatus Levybacteria bacterium GW2011_GWB1_35_5]|nr:MAG: UDP-N-acetylmuramoyl-tripeptide-D-alanyl-D-alanine ligase [Candidatus Levybacteria bacterium GW2011_GWB1_35_5]